MMYHPLLECVAEERLRLHIPELCEDQWAKITISQVPAEEYGAFKDLDPESQAILTDLGIHYRHPANPNHETSGFRRVVEVECYDASVAAKILLLVCMVRDPASAFIAKAQLHADCQGNAFDPRSGLNRDGVRVLSSPGWRMYVSRSRDGSMTAIFFIDTPEYHGMKLSHEDCARVLDGIISEPSCPGCIDAIARLMPCMKRNTPPKYRHIYNDPGPIPRRPYVTDPSYLSLNVNEKLLMPIVPSRDAIAGIFEDFEKNSNATISSASIASFAYAIRNTLNYDVVHYIMSFLGISCPSCMRLVNRYIDAAKRKPV